ncbi:MAG: CoA transferase, partial [Acidimicrobiales bacterium]
PMLLPTLVADKACGLTIANAVLAALFHRAKTGDGQYIEIPMIDVMRAFVLVEHGAGAISEPPSSDPGYARILTPERKPQPTADGWMNVLPYVADHYRSLFRAGGRDDLLEDPRFQTRQGRFANSDSLYRDVAEILKTRSTDEWLEFCEAEGIPATRTTALDDLMSELPLEEHPVAGTYRVIPPPVRFGRTPATVRSPAPTVGQHGRSVLADLGYDEAKLDRLEAEGVLYREDG